GEEYRFRWGDVRVGLLSGLSPATPVTNRELGSATSESGDLTTAIDDYVSSPSYIPGSLAPILRRIGVRWVLLQNDLNWQVTRIPRPATYNALRTDPGL